MHCVEAGRVWEGVLLALSLIPIFLGGGEKATAEHNVKSYSGSEWVSSVLLFLSLAVNTYLPWIGQVSMYLRGSSQLSCPIPCHWNTHLHALGEDLWQKLCGIRLILWLGPLEFWSSTATYTYMSAVQLVSFLSVYGGSFISPLGRICHILEFSSFGFLYVITSLMCF